MAVISPSYLARINAALAAQTASSTAPGAFQPDGTSIVVTNGVAGIPQTTPAQLPAATALAGPEIIAGSQGNAGALFNAAITPAMISTYVQAQIAAQSSSTAASGTITAGSTSAQTGANETFTFTVSNASSLSVGWVANGSTSVGASSPALVGGAVAVSGTSGSIAAPATAATYQLVLLNGSKVLALSAAVTVSAPVGIAAATPYSQTFAANATLGQQMVTGGYCTVPASYFLTGGVPCFMVLTLIGGTAGAPFNAISTSAASLGFNNHLQCQIYTPADGATQYGAYLTAGTDIETVVLARVSGTKPIVVLINGGSGLNNLTEAFPDLTGVIGIGGYMDGSNTLTSNGGAFARFGIFSGDVSAAGFAMPTWPYTSDSRHIASWSFDGTNAGA